MEAWAGCSGQKRQQAPQQEAGSAGQIAGQIASASQATERSVAFFSECNRVAWADLCF